MSNRFQVLAALAAIASADEVTDTDAVSSYYDQYSYGGGGEQCAPGCYSFWEDDGICDESCNVEACSFDGNDCSSSECWTVDDGRDYRGKVATTVSGRGCQMWARQEPWHHTKTTTNFPYDGLGGHNYCRNPDRENGPWCFTLDYPDTRWELCDVGVQSNKHCNASLLPKEKKETDTLELKLNTPVEGHIQELQLRHYDLTIPKSMVGVKVVLAPINGDADLFLSFTEKRPKRNTATWVEEAVGVSQFLLPKAGSPDWCGDINAKQDPCVLHIAVSGFESGEYHLVAYNTTGENIFGSGSTSDEAQPPPPPASCSIGCDELRLGNTVCDHSCNTSACLWDSGDCGYFGHYKMEDVCSPGCPLSWLGDAYCDEACFTAACGWDVHDCIAEDAGCADSCLPSWIDDLECDEACHTEKCGWDGSDCDHGASECYSDKDGRDYRGSVAVSRGGYTCQAWSHQKPQAHTRTHLNHPMEGVGGHNHCRNPAGEEAGPWCYTTHPGIRWELCAVPEPRSNCSAKLTQSFEYHRLCPVDCAGILGNGRCDLRCNISSCAFDSGDCGVGLDIGLISAGMTAGDAFNMFAPNIYMLVVAGILVGVCIGLAILRYVLTRKSDEERMLRGYTNDERKGMDGAQPDDMDANL